MLMGRPASVVAALNAKTVTCVMVFKTVAASGGALIDLGQAGGGNFMMANGTTVGSFVDSYMSAVPHAGQTSFTVLAFTATSYTNAGGTFTLERWYINGTCVGHVQTSAGAGPGASAQLCLGSNADNGAFVNSSFDAFEVLFFDRGLYPAEMLQVQKWACDKYGQAYPWAAGGYFYLNDGDSISMGLGGTGPATSMPYKVAQSLGLAYGQWTNVAIGGDTIANMTSRAATDVDNVYAVISKPIKYYGMEWYNQRAASPGPYNARKTANLKVCWGTSTDTSVTTDADRAAYNASFDASHAMCDSYVAVHLNANIGVETAFASFPANWSDGVHLSAAGYTVYAPLVVAGLNAIP
jgi:hypothetical protein